LSWVFPMTKSGNAPYRSIFAYHGRSTARTTAIRHPSEGRSYLFPGSNCDLTNHVGADRQNRPSNKPSKRNVYMTRDGTRGRFWIDESTCEVRFRGMLRKWIYIIQSDLFNKRDKVQLCQRWFLFGLPVPISCPL